MNERTPLWLSSYGTSSGIAITGLFEQEDTVTLLTKQVD